MLDIMKRAFGENTDTPIMSRRQAFAGAALPLAAMTVSNPAMAASGPMGDSFSVPKGRIESRQMTFTDNVAKLNAETARALQAADVRERTLNSGAEPSSSSAEEFGRFVRAEHAKWGKLIREAGIKAD